MSIRTFAAIDVGSFELSMKIFEFSGKNNMREIDCISRRLDLGSDTYATGKISNEKVSELCRTLREFKMVMDSYKVEAYRAYGTSAIRESENAMILLDRIEQWTGIRVEVLSNSEQRFLHYKSIASMGETYRKIIEQKTAIVDIGGGSIQLSLFENDTLISTQNLRLGVLRLQEMIHHLNAKPGQVEALVEEMASPQLSSFKKMYLKDYTIKNIIVMDDYLSPMAVRNGGGSKEGAISGVGEYDRLLELLRTHSRMQAAAVLDITEEKVPLLNISTILLKRIATMIGAEKIWAPGCTLCDGIAYEYAERNKLLNGEHDFEKDILACAINMSKRYMGSRKRAETLEKITLAIFDSMKKIHGLGKRDRFYLRLAALLHDCGKYISMVNIGETSYNIIMATEMIGLSHKEREIVANVVRYNHTPFLYYKQTINTDLSLDREAYLVVAKLAAILRIAHSLDCTQKQKIKEVRSVLKDNQLILTVDTAEDLTLEKGFFEDRAGFFQEVFSVQPVMKQKRQF